MKWILAVAKLGLQLIYLLFRPFPVQNKVVMLSRESDTPPIDFVLIQEELARVSPETEVVCFCRKMTRDTNPLSYCLFLLRSLYHIATASVAVTDSACVYFNKSTRKIPVYSVDVKGEKKVIALTFDAAWGADKTQGIIDILNSHGAKGTFFLVGFWIDKYQEETKAIANAGFDIGNHSRNHLNMPKLSEVEIKNEILYVNDRVKDLTGKTPKYFRAPFGDYDNKLMTSLESLDMVGVQWSIDSLDWKGLSAKQIYDK